MQLQVRIYIIRSLRVFEQGQDYIGFLHQGMLCFLDLFNLRPIIDVNECFCCKQTENAKLVAFLELHNGSHLLARLPCTWVNDLYNIMTSNE